MNEYKRTKIIKKIALFASVATIGLSLTGCGWDDIQSNTDNAENVFNQLESRNQDFINLLEQQGLLSSREAKNYTESLQSKMTALKNTMKSDGNSSTTVQDDVMHAITPETQNFHKNFKRKNGTVSVHKDGTIYLPYTKEDPNKPGVWIEDASLPLDTSQQMWDPNDVKLSSGVNMYYNGEFFIEQACDCTPNPDGSKDHTVHLIPQSLPKFDTINQVLTRTDRDGKNGVVDKIKNLFPRSNIQCRGEAYRLFDSTQVTSLTDALTRPIYIVTKFDANHTAAKFQAVLAILGDDKEEAKRIVEDLGLKNATISSGSTGNTLDKYADYTGNLSDAQLTALENFLMQYCEPCTYDDGTPVTYLRCKGYSGYDRVDPDDTAVPYIFADTRAVRENFIGTDETQMKESTLGDDVTVLADGKAAISIRIMEFNPDLIDALKEQDRLSDDNKTRGKFYKTTKSSTLAAIRLDYPMYKIDSIKTDSTTSEDWKVKIKDTGLFMDLGDGSVYDDQHYVLEYANQKLYTKESVLFWDYNYVDADDPNSQKVQMTDTYTNKSFTVHPLVLRDYVELYYIREGDNDIVDGTPSDSPEFWIPIGRRLRVTKLKGGKEDINKFARSLAFDGTLPESVNYISLDKISDRTSGYGFYEGVTERLGLGVDNPTEIQNKINESPRTDDMRLMDVSGGTYTLDTFGLTQKEAMFNEIFPTICLGETQEMNADGVRYDAVALAQTDHDSVYTKGASGTYTAPTVYGMTLSTPLTSANITGGDWIGNTENASTGVQDWNLWLSDNHFNYRVPLRKILELLGIAIDQLNDGDSAITFDGETLKYLTNKYEEDAKTNLEVYVRTMTVIIGFIIQAYALLLLGAWVFDTNIYDGPQLVKKMTFGKWEAVKDKGEYASDTGEIHYMDLKDMIFALVKFTAIGVLLWFFDPYDLMNILKQHILPLMDTFKSMILGG